MDGRRHPEKRKELVGDMRTGERVIQETEN